MKQRKLIWSLLCLALNTVSYAPAAQDDYIVRSNTGWRDSRVKQASNPSVISIAELLVRPNDFKGKAISIRGFLSTGEDDNAIYLTKDSYEYGISENAISVNFDTYQRRASMAYSGRLVLIEGVVDTISEVSGTRATINPVSRLLLSSPGPIRKLNETQWK